ncbi:ribonuclease P protein component [Gammaproteobacteria bacterium LSUCC0112]|nr:ribonuclease P protein component [Gammaproteobacteria bacterium LSUCC0112]
MTDQSFGRKLRLLTASDYKAVFGKAEFKVSSPQLLILAIKSGYETPRLGLVIAKKHIRQAVQRNRIKRLLRESFRAHQQLLNELDIVILARSGADSLDNKTFVILIEKLWQDLIRRRKRLTAR